MTKYYDLIRTESKIRDLDRRITASFCAQEAISETVFPVFVVVNAETEELLKQHWSIWNQSFIPFKNFDRNIFLRQVPLSYQYD